MNEQDIVIELSAKVIVNGVEVTDAVVIAKKTIVTIGELNVVLPNVSVGS